MISKITCSAVLIVILCTATQIWAASGEDNDYTAALEKMKLFVPDDPAQRSYLGINEKNGQMTLADIEADVLIIEIFSMYCPHCQKHAPVANKLYQAVENNTELKDKIRMIGIGIGNSPYEVGVFREKYLPLFPLFDDRNSAVVNAFSGILTPHYFGLKKKADSTFELFYSKAGGYTDAGEFLEMIVKLSGIKPGEGQ